MVSSKLRGSATHLTKKASHSAHPLVISLTHAQTHKHTHTHTHTPPHKRTRTHTARTHNTINLGEQEERNDFNIDQSLKQRMSVYQIRTNKCKHLTCRNTNKVIHTHNHILIPICLFGTSEMQFLDLLSRAISLRRVPPLEVLDIIRANLWKNCFSVYA